MCVRYGLNQRDLRQWTETIVKRKGERAVRIREDLPDDAEAFPGDAGTIALLRDDALTLEPATWGLMPAWAKPPEYKPDFGRKNAYNARAETVFEKPSFRAAAKYRRCLVPMTRFYERTHGRWLRMKFHEAGAFAAPGLFADPEPGVSDTTTYTVVTTEANETIAEVHDRMPVILDPRDYDAWLDPEAKREDLRKLLIPCPPEWFTIEDAGPIGRAKKAEATLFEPV